MKKKLLAVATLVLAICLIFTASVRADNHEVDSAEGAKASLKHGDTVKYYDDLNEAIKVAEDNDKVTLLESVTLNDGTSVVCENGKSITLDMNGFDISSTSNTASTFRVGHSSTIVIENSKTTGGNITHTGAGDRIPLLINSGTVTLKSNVTCKLTGTRQSTTSSSFAVKVGQKAETTNDAKLIVDGGKVESTQSGVSIVGTKSSVEVKSGLVKASDFGIAEPNGSATNSTITVSGGTVESENYAGIYKPNTGSVTVSGTGVVKGKLGIVARRGDVTISGGEVIATGKASEKIDVGNGVDPLEGGTAVIIDNNTESYKDDTAKVAITGGKLTANDGQKPVTGYVGENGDENDYVDNISITGGAFSDEFNQAFVKNNKTEVSVTDKSGNKTYYVGQDVINAVNEAAKNKDAVVEVLAGDLKILGAVDGFTIKNSGKGNVTVNGMKVTANEEVVVETEDEEQDDTPKMGTVNVFAVAGAILVVSALGVVVLNKRK